MAKGAKKSADAPKAPSSARHLSLRRPGAPSAAAAAKPAEPAAEPVDEKKEAQRAEVADTFSRVFAGQFRDIPAPLSKLVRVFTSSTFTDTMVERNALMEEVYPALKRYCRETHGLDFQVCIR